ncbi:cyclase family protein [Solwaraspora sp. WMMD406]|uniref:cyclase family protein n=1 Tax=Solwaraspora sp. WMMD406 TaxID=3016095 RepID=UPI0024165DE1|nr:cyclase family protein [Solwaraspora sp. WMMD406]MDG4762775.1 cyclase family protein [Solwaraspora sp. WMMD406]
MTVVNLTLPLYPFMPVGNVWAWDSPFQLTPTLTHRRHGVSVHQMSFHSEAGTRLMLGACYDDTAPRVDELDYGPLVNRPTVVFDVPKEAGAEIDAADIDRLADDPDYRDGDAVLLRTGWGDDQRYRTLGDEYASTSPHFSLAGAERLATLLKEKNSDLMLTDCAYIGNLGEAYMYPEWSSRQPWDRPPFPSQQARIYLRHYTPQRGAGGGAPDWASSVVLHAATSPVAALANCGALRGKRITVTVLPLFLAGAHGAPCTVWATDDTVEEIR